MPDETVQTDQATTPEGGTTEQTAPVDPALQAEIQNSIKLRKRAQEAETRLQEIEAAREAERVAKLEADGKLAELNEELTGKNTALESEVTQWREYQATERDRLNALLPDNHRELTTNLSLAQLQKYVEIHATKAPATPGGDPPGGRGHIQRKNIADMTPEERRLNWQDIIQGG